jgi:hypothetical protein
VNALTAEKNGTRTADSTPNALMYAVSVCLRS